MKNRLISLLIAAVLAVVFLSGIAAAEELEVHLGDQPSFFILKIADYNGYFTGQVRGTVLSDSRVSH